MSVPGEPVEDERGPGRSAPTPGFFFRSEVVVAAAIAAFGAWVLYLTAAFDRPPPILSPGLQPHAFPQLMVYVMYALAAVIVVQGWKQPAKQREPIVPIVFASAGAVAGFVVLSQVDMFLGFIAFFIGLSLLWGERRLVPLVITALMLPLMIFVLFDQVLEVRFPRGLLTNIYYDW